MKHLHEPGREERRRITETVKEVLRQDRNIVFAFLYGSFIDSAAFRDIDVGVFVRNVAASSFVDRQLTLSRQIEDALPMPLCVDVKVINRAPLPFRFNVIRGELLLCRDDEMLEEFMVSTARKYLDFAPVRRRYIKEAMES